MLISELDCGNNPQRESGPTWLASHYYPLSAVGYSLVGGEIREFSLTTIEKLDGELSRRDSIAARAVDLVAKSQPLAKSLKRRGCRLHYLRNSRGAVSRLRSDISRCEKPAVQDRGGQPLPTEIARRYKAQRTVKATLQGKFFDINYNFEVLDAPDGSGFLVYPLAATDREREFPTGGHGRVTVSNNGSLAERVDFLSQFMKSRAKPGAEIECFTPTQVASNIPVETIPWFVAIRESRIATTEHNQSQEATLAASSRSGEASRATGSKGNVSRRDGENRLEPGKEG